MLYAPLASVFLLMLCGAASLFLKSKRFSIVAPLLFLGIASVSSLYLMGAGASGQVLAVLSANAFSELLFGVLAFGLMLIAILSYGKVEAYAEFALLMSFIAFGAFMVCFAYSIIAIIVGIEAVLLSTVFSMLLDGKRYVEPAIKLFLLGAISIALFVTALAMLMPYDASLALAAVSTSPAGKFIVGLSLVLFAAALSIEAAAFPFNLWIPDVYQGARGNITALMAGINKKVALIAVLELFLVVFVSYGAIHGTKLVTDLFFIMAVMTMFFGNLLALAQSNVKRMFAYSSISQAGYILIGVSAATQLGIEGSIFYIVSHMFMIIGAFAIVFWLESRNINTLEEYSGLWNRNHFAAASLTILMLSMAGIPPLVGFAGKFILFSSAVYANDALLAFVGILNSFISIYYYARLINQMFSSKEEARVTIDRSIALVVCVCLAFVVIVGIYPQVLLGAASAAAAAL